MAYFAHFELLPIFRTADSLIGFSHTSLLGRTEVFRAAAAAQDGEQSVQKLPHLLVAATLILQHFPSITLSLLQLFPFFLYFYGRNFTTPLLLGRKMHCYIPS